MSYTLDQRRECLERYHIKQERDIEKISFASDDLSEKYVDMQAEHILKYLNADSQTVTTVRNMSMQQKMEFVKQYSYKPGSTTSSERGSVSNDSTRTNTSRPHTLPAQQRQENYAPSIQDPAVYYQQYSYPTRPSQTGFYQPSNTWQQPYVPTSITGQEEPVPPPRKHGLRRMYSEADTRQKVIRMIPRALSMNFGSASMDQNRRSMPTTYHQPLPRPPIHKRGSSNILNAAIKENTPTWYILQIADRNSSLKSLGRLLGSLQTMLSLSGNQFVEEFVGTTVPNVGRVGLNGTSALEIALDRICLPQLKTTTYANHIIPDELRLQVMKCVRLIMKVDIGMEQILKSRGLMRQIIWCFRIPSPAQQVEMKENLSLRTAYINLRTLMCEIFGPACLLDEILKESVIQIMQEIQKYQNEPLPFFYLVASMNNPFTFDRGSTRLENRDGLDFSYLADYADIWNYRTQLFLFFNGLVSSSDSISERIRVRKIIESCGFRGIIKKLMEQNPMEDFKNQYRSYEEDRKNDMQEQESKFHSKNIEMQSSNVLFENLLESVKKLPDPEMAQHFVVSTIAHLNDIVVGLQRSKGNEDDLGSRTDISSILALIERSTHSVADSVGSWGVSSKKSMQEQIDQLQLHFYETVDKSMSELNHARKGGTLRQVVQELHDVRDKYKESKALAETYRKQLNHLRSTIQSRSAMQKQQEDSLFGLQPIESGSLMESIPKEFLETNDAKSPDWDLNPPEALQKLGKAAGIGMLWLEIQRLEELVQRLQERRKDDALIHTKPNHISPPIPPPVIAPPPPPPPPPAPPLPPPPPKISNNAPKPIVPKPIDIILKAKVPMKPLQWEKLPKHIANQTIWKELFKNAYELNVLNEPELVDLFQKADQPQRTIVTEKKPEIVRFLDQKMAQNLEILLTSFKCSHEEVRDSLLCIYDEMLTLDRVVNLKPLIPDADVMESILTYSGPLELLGIAEQFIKCIYDVPRLSTRLDSIIFRLRYFQDIREVHMDLQSLLSATEQVKGSSKFKMILQVVLVIGNYLNGTSFRGNATGFKVDSLLCIKDTKPAGIDAKYYPSLLHYVAKCVREQFPESLDFAQDMPDLFAAARISVNSLNDCVLVLSKGFLELEKELEDVERIGCYGNDKFLEVFKPFYEESKGQIEKMIADSALFQENLIDLLDHFGEDVNERKKEPRKFFDTIVQFSQMLQVH
jgi:hypothetical protein